jgi:hypothetical protein
MLARKRVLVGSWLESFLVNQELKYDTILVLGG